MDDGPVFAVLLILQVCVAAECRGLAVGRSAVDGDAVGRDSVCLLQKKGRYRAGLTFG